MNEIDGPIGLFTFDFMKEVLKKPEDHNPGEIIILDDTETPNIEQHKEEDDYMFDIDADINNYHEGGSELARQYGEALNEYLVKFWEISEGLFKEFLVNYPNDGPAEMILSTLNSYNNVAPENWPGYRNIDEEVQPQATEEEEDDKEEKKASKDVVKEQLAIIEEKDDEESSSNHPSVKRKQSTPAGSQNKDSAPVPIKDEPPPI